MNTNVIFELRFRFLDSNRIHNSIYGSIPTQNLFSGFRLENNDYQYSESPKTDWRKRRLRLEEDEEIEHRTKRIRKMV